MRSGSDLNTEKGIKENVSWRKSIVNNIISMLISLFSQLSLDCGRWKHLGKVVKGVYEFSM